MKNLAFVLLVACGPKQPTTPSNTTHEIPPDNRTEIEKRRDGACDTLGPRITECALEDAKAQYEAGKVSKSQFEQDTAPGVLKKNTEEFVKDCRKSDYSSRQIRVLEVCQKEETECGPLLACLDNLNKQ
ncbi:MAG TPA: hypothetical protein VMZ53_01535 [Kofleriaceae bacterium]|nr:hypothetical protein [Kofleriaceae bacterium]